MVMPGGVFLLGCCD